MKIVNKNKTRGHREMESENPMFAFINNINK